MAESLPDYYFRVRENGAIAFRVDSENRHRRLELEQIATINMNNGKVNPHGDHTLTEEDNAAISEWISNRKDLLAQRDIDDIHRAVDYLNITTQWLQSNATDEQLEDVTDRLLLAMHDLRSVLVRKKANRLTKAKEKT